MKTIVIAIGGNSLISDAWHMSVPDQYAAIVQTARQIADLLERRCRVVITHGNGPQVGFILRRSEHSRGILHEVPLDSIVADTQGALGYQIQQALGNEFRRRGLTAPRRHRRDPDPGGSRRPGLRRAEQADRRVLHARSRPRSASASRAGRWSRTPGRGWRRVVASPQPVRIIEADVIRRLADAHYVVVAAGGGGIPVVATEPGVLRGVAAVIDKDLASAVLAHEIGADLLVISTAVEKVCLDFGKPGQRALDAMTVAEARRYIAAGQFPAGSMLPKVEACVRFIARAAAARHSSPAPRRWPRCSTGTPARGSCPRAD